MDGNGGVDDVLHLLAQGVGVVGRHGTAQMEVDIIAVADGDVDADFTGFPVRFVEQFVGRLAKNEKQGARVCSQSGGRRDVEKFHLHLAVDAVVHAFHLVIYPCGDGSVRHFETRQPVGFFEL